MNYYQNTIRFTLYLLLLLQITFYFLGYLRPSIIYDYLDYWPITIFPILLLTIFRSSSSYEILRNAVNIFLVVVVLIFSFGHLFDSKLLTTYKYDSFFQNDDLSSDHNYVLLIDIDGKINLNSFQGRGYTSEIIDQPGNIGYPEAIETVLGEPRAIVFRQLETSNLLKVKGWNIYLGNQNIWELDFFSLDSFINLDDIKLQPSKLSGTGEIYLGSNLEIEKLSLSGNYEVTVSKDLSILVKGQANIPDQWLNASVGKLNYPDKTYTVIIEIIDGSQVIFKDG